MTTDTTEFPTKQAVIRALSALYANRSKRDGFDYVRSILRRFGAGATNINELKPAYHESVLRAVGALSPTLPDAKPGDWDFIDPPAPSSRARTALVADLQARLAAAKAKTRRSTPNFPVNIGNPTRVGEDRADDVSHDSPAGQKVC